MKNRAFDHSKYKDWIRPEEVTPYEKNAKKHDDRQIQNIANSINRFGWQQDVVITADNVLVIGHGRRMAAIEIGCEMPYHMIDKNADELTDKDIRELRIADNQTNAETGFDWEMFAVEAEDLDFDGFDFDFDVQDEFGEESEDVVEDEYDPEPPEEPITKRGDIWQLGEHRLMVGDSTSEADIRALMDGELADLWLTDPPYNVNYQGTAGKIQNDNMGNAQFHAFLVAANKAAYENMRNGASFYIWHADSEGLNFRGACEETGLHVRECLIWVKNSLVLGHSDYQWRHEPCLFGHKSGAPHYFTNSRAETTVIDEIGKIDPEKMKKDELVALFKRMMAELPTTVIEMDKPKKNGEHPTMKPVALFDYLIRNSTKRGEIVLDSFAGSGTTIMACEQDGRKARVMELDPKFADVILNRWMTFTGEQAFLVKKSGKIPFSKVRDDRQKVGLQ